MAKKKTIKYLENGEYHDATVKDVGVIEELKTESKDNLVEAINEIFLGGGKGFSDLQQKVEESTQAAQNAQQATNNLQQKLDEVAQNVGLSDEEAQRIINQAVEDAKRAQAEALQAYEEARKELDDSIAQFMKEKKELDDSIVQFMEEQKEINKELEQAKDDIQSDIEQKNAEVEQINTVIENTKSDLTATAAQLANVKNDLSNAQMDWGKVRQEITNINGKLDSKMSNTDFDEYKERIERNETEITQTKNVLQSKATKQDLDVLTGTVTTQGSSITQLSGKIEEKVSKDTLANDIDDFQVKKANIFTGTREFMGWEFSDKALGRVNDDIYNHAKVAELHNGSNLSITVNGLEVGKTYSVSIFAKASANSNTSGVKVTVDNGKSYSGLMRTVYTPHDTKVTTNWQRYYATIVSSATTMKFVFDRSGMTSDITLYLNRPKLEVGKTVYAWEDNAQDIYKRVEHTEAQFDVYNDQISGIVKRQTETDKKIENVSSTFTQRADGIEANAKKYTNDKVTGLTEEFSGRLKATSQELSTEYEKQTNAKIGALADGGSNLILNSSFLVTDNNGNATLENWRDTSSKISLTKPNGLDGTWIKVNRAATGTALGARSNYFPVKQGKLVVGVDVALDGTGNISPYVLRIEYYDASNNRVNYEDITLQKLGLSASQITKSGSNFRYARGVYKTSNDRSDVAKACIVVPETITGYDMYLTNFFAKFSDVNDGTYEVNPLDQQASLIKQRTKIEQDSEKINLLNTQTEKLGNDIKATNTSVSVLKGEVDLKATQSTVNDLTNRVSKNEADIKVFPDRIKSEVREVSKKIDGVNDKVDNMQVGGTNLLKESLVPLTTSDIWTVNGVSNQIVDDYVRIRGLGDNNRIYQTFYNNGLNADGYYSISFWASNDGNGEEFDVQVGTWGSLQTVHITGSTLKLYKLENVWLGGNPTFSFVAPFGKVVRLKKIKLEKGNKVTDWSPAPEDADSAIELVKSVATQTKDGFERLTQKTGYNASTGEFAKVTTQINEGINGVSSEVKSVSNRLDNMRVGGTNLMAKTTRDYVKFTGDGWGVSYLTPNNQAIDVPVIGGETYTFSAWVKNDSSSAGRIDLEIYQWNAKSENKQNGSSSEVGVWVSPGEEKRLVFTKTLLADTTRIRLHTRSRDNNGTVTYWTKMAKVEKGNVPTDWSPAPEDADSAIELVKSVATQTKDGFERLTQKTGYNASTGEFAKVTTQINEGINGVSSEVKSVSNRLDNMRVGGTNLLKDSLVPLTASDVWIADGVSSQVLDDYVRIRGMGDNNRIYQPFSNNGLNADGYYSISFWASNDNNEEFDVQAGTWNSLQTVHVTGGFKLYKIENVWLGGNPTFSFVAPFGKVVRLKKIKLEKGTIATDWTPAPEDLQEGINIATTKATQTDTKFERMLSQIQYNDSTGEIGKYEHKITELSNGTQEKISAIQLDNDKKLQSATQTLTNKIGDLESTVRTNTTNIGQYRQEMTNSAKELSTKFTSYQNLIQNDIAGVKNKVDNIQVGGTNLLKDSLVPLTASNIWVNNGVSNQIVDDYVRIRGMGDNGDNNRIFQTFSNNGLNADGYYSISFWASNDGNGEEFDVQVGTWGSLQTVHITGSTLKLYKLENVWLGGNPTFSFVAPFGKVVRLKKIKLEKGNKVTDWSPAPEDADSKIEILQGQITANANKFNTVYTKTDIDNKINPLNSRTEFLQDNSKFLLRVQQAGGATQADVNSANSKISGLTNRVGATQADVNSANSKIGDLSTRVKNTEVAITSGGVTINGSTVINGDLNVDNIALKGEEAEIKISGDNIQLKNENNTFSFSNNGLSLSNNNGNNSIVVGSDGFFSNWGQQSFTIYGSKDGIEMGKMTNSVHEILGQITVTQLDPNINGIGVVIEPQQVLGGSYGGDIFTISRTQDSTGTSGNPSGIYHSMIYDAVGKSSSIGRYKGFTFQDGFRVIPPGAGNGIAFGWVQFGSGYKTPAIVNSGSSYGGVAFPRDGNTYMFNTNSWWDGSGKHSPTYSGWFSEG